MFCLIVQGMDQLMSYFISKINTILNLFRYVHQGNIFECGETEWDRSFEINVKSMYRMCHAFLPKVNEIQKIS